MPSSPQTHTGSSRHSLLDRGGVVVLVMVLGFVVPEIAWVVWGRTLAPPAAASVERQMLVASAILVLVLPVIQIVLSIRWLGGDAVRGNRERFPTLDGVVGRVARAHANLVESFAPFAVVVLLVHLEHLSNRMTVAAATLYPIARLVHAVTYACGVTVIRSAAFYAALIATLQIAYQAFQLT